MFISMKECINAIGGKPFRAVIHIGGHHAEEAQDYAANGVERVIWVEANKSVMKHLFNNASKFPMMKQEYLNYCLSDEDDVKVTFNIANNGQSSSILELGKHKDLYPHIVYTEKTELTAHRFDTVAKKHNIDVDLFDFINLDVQGAELMVLKGFGDILNKSNIKAVYSEVNTDEIYVGCAKIEELDEFLARGSFFRIATRMEPGAGWGDALWLRT